MVNNQPIIYRSGYKYQLSENHVFDLGDDFRAMWKGTTHMQGDYLLLSSDGRLTICAGYCWDGASGGCPDLQSIRRAALCHDALYQLIRHGVLPDYSRLIADRLFREICIQDGLSRPLAAIAYRLLRMFAYKAAAPGQARKRQSSPK